MGFGNSGNVKPYVKPTVDWLKQVDVRPYPLHVEPGAVSSGRSAKNSSGGGPFNTGLGRPPPGRPKKVRHGWMKELESPGTAGNSGRAR
eukprot:COSAG05_NODE_1725_length_4206_cov_2.026784_3_plen_89_part_00